VRNESSENDSRTLTLYGCTSKNEVHHNDRFHSSGRGQHFPAASTQRGSQELETKEHIGADNGYQPYWPIVVIEHRYILAIIAGIQADGLTVRGGSDVR